MWLVCALWGFLRDKECRSCLGLCPAADQMRGGAPGVTRERFEAADSVDASNRLVCAHRSSRDRAECRFAVRRLQLAECFRAVFQLDQCLPGWPSIGRDFLLRFERLG